MLRNSSLNALPLSPCTSGSLGLDFFSNNPTDYTPMSSTSNLKTMVNNTLPTTTTGEAKNEDADQSTTDDEDDGNDSLAQGMATMTIVAPAASTLTSDDAPLAPSVKATPLVRQETKTVATGIPQRPVLSGQPTHTAARGLSAASLALKRKQAEENAAAAVQAIKTANPETDSISNRIQMFGGGGHPGRAGPGKRLLVRDMVNKFKQVEDKQQEEIAQLKKSSKGTVICPTYSLSTASRPTTVLRPTPRRMTLNGSDSVQKSVRQRQGEEEEAKDKEGIQVERLQSVKNAKSLFENMGRTPV